MMVVGKKLPPHFQCVGNVNNLRVARCIANCLDADWTARLTLDLKLNVHMKANATADSTVSK